ncbi:MAG: helix-turn-helix domain-containing protein, partial [Pseudomonadota bacterium]
MLMLLAHRHNPDTGQCNPSEDTLMEATGLEARTVRMHLKALEDAGLIERLYKHGGRGVGRSVAGFHLKIGIIGAVKSGEETRPKLGTLPRKKIATAEYCHGKNTSLPRQNTANLYKEEPKKNLKTKAVFVHFESCWQAWRKMNKRAATANKQAAQKQWSKAIERAGGEDALRDHLVAAIAYHEQFGGGTDRQGRFVPNMCELHRWLKEARWEGLDLKPVNPSNVPVQEWTARISRWVRTRHWPREWGHAPDVVGCTVPADALRTGLDALEPTDPAKLIIEQTLLQRERRSQLHPEGELFAIKRHQQE